MSATNELRRLLDERGVKWRRAPHYSSKSVDNETIFSGNGIEWYAREYDDDYVELRTLRFLVTPSQAVGATVGRETCRFNVVFYKDFATPRHPGNICKCDACGYQRLYGLIVDARFKYCPNCGARIEAVG